MLIGDGNAGDGSVEAMSQCLLLRFRVGLQGPGMVFAAVNAREVLPGDQLPGREICPSPGCTRGLDRVEKAFSNLLQSPGIIEGRPGGRIALVGRAGEALLERPSEVPADLYQHTPWQMWGAWHVQSMTLGDQAVPIRAKSISVLFKTNRIEAQASCKVCRLPYREEGDRLTIYPRQNPGGCERDDFHDERAFSKIMTGDVTIAHSSPTARLVVGRAGSIRLVRPWVEPSSP